MLLLHFLKEFDELLNKQNLTIRPFSFCFLFPTFAEIFVKGIKKFIYILLRLAALFFLILLSGYLVLKNDKLQRKVVNVVTESLSEKVQSEVKLTKIEWDFPNSLILNDVYIEDQSQDTLLSIDRTKVTLNLMDLFQARVSFRTIQMVGMTAHINKKDSTYNFQFFVDAFRKKDSTQSIQWSMDVESIAFDDCTIYYKNEKNKPRAKGFDPSDIGIEKLNGYLHVKCFTEDSINIKLHNISFEEKSGLTLSSLSTSFYANQEMMTFNNFVVRLPNSLVAFNDATFYHDNYKAFNDLTNKMMMNVDIAPSNIKVKDLAALVPRLETLEEKIFIEGLIQGRGSDVNVGDLKIQYGESTHIIGDMRIKGLPYLKDMSVFANFEDIYANPNEMKEIAEALLEREIKLPSFVNNLEYIGYEGSIEGDLSELQSYGKIKSNIGDISNNVRINSADDKFTAYSFNGSIYSDNLALGKLFGEKSHLGNAGLHMDIIVDKNEMGNVSVDAQGSIDSLSYKNYTYKNIEINGLFNKKEFKGVLALNDPNASLKFDGNINWNHDKPLYRFLAEVKDMKLDKLNLAKTPNTTISFNVEVNAKGNNANELEGSASIDNILFTKGEKELYIANASLVSDKKEGISSIRLYSDYINGEVKGHYKVSSIYKNLKNLAKNYLPSIIKESPSYEYAQGNNFSFNFNIENINPIHEIVTLPVSISEQGSISGFYNDSLQKARIKIEAEQLSIGKTNLEDCVLLVENPYDHVKIMVRGTHLPRNSRRTPYFLSLNAKIKNDSIDTEFNFNNSAEVTYGGKVKLSAFFKSLTKEGLTADFLIHPSEIILSDTTWSIKRSTIELAPRNIVVNDFQFFHDDQALSINGQNSSNEKDSLHVHLNKLNLGYVSDIVNQKYITFGGLASGDINLYKIFSHPHIDGDLGVIGASINEYGIGDLNVNSFWNPKEKCIGFKGTLDNVLPNKELARSDIFGGVFIGNDSLYIEGDLKEVSLKFLRLYIGNIMHDNTGTVSGNVKAYGKFNQIGLEGKAFAKDFGFGIDYLKTFYTLTDTVILTPTTIQLKKTPVFDTEGNKAIVNGILHHRGFRDFKFDVNVNCDNFIALNTREQDNSIYYGKAYADGPVRIYGTPNEVNFFIDLKTRPNTKLTIPLGNSATASNSDFITFIKKEEELSAIELKRQRREKMRTIEENKKSKTQLNLDLNIEATKDAVVQLIMDARQGDMIKGTGNGKIRLTYSSKESGMNMYGSYEILKGEYFFTIQSLISRKFDIMGGSLLRWTGSPYDAIIDINAKYALNTSLNEILDDPNLRSTLTPVHCLLNLTGTLRRPNIKFDLNLPNSDADLTSRLKSVINTEELMNRNAASLLALGHFYTMDKSDVNSSTELSSVGFSTLSSQISNWMSSINEDVNIGLNYKPSDGVSTSNEFDVALSTQLWNDRLLVNGNFGYREDMSNVPNTNTSNSIVDFDIEYKLTPNGKYSVKAFNRTNDSYFKQSPNTQGIGVTYRESFDTFGELVNYYTNPLRIWISNDKKKKKGKKEEPEGEEKGQPLISTEGKENEGE